MVKRLRPSSQMYRAPRRPPGAGRKAGTKNQHTRILKDAILLAAEQVGADRKGTGGLTGYLRRIAVAYPESFVSLLMKVLPLQVQASSEINLNLRKLTTDEVKEQLRERGIPIPGLFDGPAELLPPQQEPLQQHVNGHPTNGHASNGHDHDHEYVDLQDPDDGFE